FSRALAPSQLPIQQKRPGVTVTPGLCHASPQEAHVSQAQWANGQTVALIGLLAHRFAFTQIKPTLAKHRRLGLRSRPLVWPLIGWTRNGARSSREVWFFSCPPSLAPALCTGSPSAFFADPSKCKGMVMAKNYRVAVIGRTGKGNYGHGL